MEKLQILTVGIRKLRRRPPSVVEDLMYVPYTSGDYIAQYEEVFYMAKQESKNARTRITVYLSPESNTKCEARTKLAGCTSRSDFVEKAVCFYSGYLASQIYTNFFAAVIAETVEGVIASTENRLTKLLFKIAVEMAKLEQMLAAINDMDDETLQRLHIRCVNEVKRINGNIRMEDAVRYQRSDG